MELNRREHFRRLDADITLIRKSVPEITPVTLEDISLFRKFFSLESFDTYGHGWSYITQAMNSSGRMGLGYKYLDDENLISFVAYPRVSNPDNFAFYIILPLGETSLEKVIYIRDQIRQKGYTNPIYVKKINSFQREYLSNFGFRDVSRSNNPWYNYSPLEDDSYPELLVQPSRTFDMLSRLDKRSRLKRAHKAHKALGSVCASKSTLPSKTFSDLAWQVTLEFFKTTQGGPDSPNISNPYDYYNMLFNNPKHKNVKAALIFKGKDPVGYYIMERSYRDSNVWNLYALITLRNRIKGLADFTMFELMRAVNAQHFINLGGSETIGLHKFKMKYSPIKVLQMYWMVDSID